MINLDFYNRKIKEKLASDDLTAEDEKVLKDLQKYGEELTNLLFN